MKIPEARRLKPEQNIGLMAEITEEGVIQSIADLNRHKAAGGDGLNNDFFKENQAELVPAMVAIGNALIKGGEPLVSFQGGGGGG